ncbi:serine/threonine-protein phosphatase 6 regulatory ankyrin repeat subunit C-like [Ostrea edulis]|uniref:serine/threonine-protein phosphatase 6 regulatory ankyrin repeat subunit C-like n=1 Tax=Ostrea edulis TaxID=37623 RepID=UPI0024AFC4DC|nr:serine/threonine-protein phosphatase 6 regulatory ankyrin repeat subunit C-like [Ostrea edulis]
MFRHSSILCEPIKERQEQIIEAIKENNLLALEKLICQDKVSPNFYINDTTPICTAATEGNEAVLALLLCGHCVLDTPDVRDDVWKRKPIHIAASRGHGAFLKLLLEHFKDVNVKDGDGRTALHWAAIFGYDDVTEILLKAGANVNGAQRDGFTPLYAATCFGHIEVCRALLKYRADAMLCDEKGWNIIHTAADYGHLQILKLLSLSGPCLSCRTVAGENALHIATSGGHLHIVKHLVQNDIPLNTQTKEGYTALHLSVKFNRTSVCKFLLQAGANMYILNNEGQSICYLIALRMDPTFIKLLVDAGYSFGRENWILRNSFPATCTHNKSEGIKNYMRNIAQSPLTLFHLCQFKTARLLGWNFETLADSLPLPTYLKQVIKQTGP